MPVRGIRGAIDIESDHPEEILAATRELLQEIQNANPGLRIEDIASVIFTTTADLISAYPAKAAREMGWDAVPLICSQEIPVPGGLMRPFGPIIPSESIAFGSTCVLPAAC